MLVMKAISSLITLRSLHLLDNWSVLSAHIRLWLGIRISHVLQHHSKRYRLTIATTYLLSETQYFIWLLKNADFLDIQSNQRL